MLLEPQNTNTTVHTAFPVTRISNVHTCSCTTPISIYYAGIWESLAYIPIIAYVKVIDM